MSISFHSPHSGSKRGFTLIELLLVVTIMLILTGVFLIRQQNFNGSTVLGSLAYSVALSLRQAQLYGTATRETSVGSFQSAIVAKAYGIYIDSSNPDSYKLFADLNNDGKYTVSPDETVQIFKIAKGYTISKFCANATCYPTNSSLTDLTILFRRPNPDACFATALSPNACAIGAAAAYSTASVQLKGGNNNTRSVSINLTGQISVGASGS
jgi:prepilin-type N-terminal cleavage/methylation domain-containing protein